MVIGSWVRAARAGALFVALATCGALSLPAAAGAAVETLRWQDPNPSSAAGFKVYVGPSSGNYGTPIDVGRPAKDSTGAHRYSLNVADGARVYAAITAYDSQGRESAFSNEGVYGTAAPPPPPPPDPEPEPEPEPEPDPGGGGDGDGGSGGGDGGSGGGDGGSGDGGSGGGGGGSGALIWSENFESRTSGKVIPDWKDTANNGASVDDALFSVGSLSGNKVLVTSSTETALHSHYEGAGSSNWTGYEVRGRMRVAHADGRIGVTAYSQYPREDAYYSLSTAWQTGEFELHGHPNPWLDMVDVSCRSKGTGVVAAPNVWFRYRLMVEVDPDVTRVRAKIWRDGQAEPAGWQADCSHALAELPYKGTVGVWAGRDGAKYWDDFEVIDILGGAGQPEPVPIGPPGRPTLVQ